MSPEGYARAHLPPLLEVRDPASLTSAAVFSSPHSGREYPDELLAATTLSAADLRRSEDSFVDELFAHAPDFGAPLLHARFPRAFVDVNREPFELDPEMFAAALPGYVNGASPRVAAGLGTIARTVSEGLEIYRGKLAFADVLLRIQTCYEPYHQALRALVARALEQFGHCIVIDCHSMPSGRPHGMARTRLPRLRTQPDFVLGDCHGASCDGQLVELVEAALREIGYDVRRNVPYSGGFITRNYGAPESHVHALQIEINRALYMDEDKFARLPALTRIAQDMRAVYASVAACSHLLGRDRSLRAAAE